MEINFTERVKGKSKEDLLRIILNKEEYNNELVSAAEKELRLRIEVVSPDMDAPKPNPAVRISPPGSTILVNEENETPFGIYFAGILLILSAIFWISVASLQVGVGSLIDEGSMKGIGVWNIFMAVAHVVIAIGVFTRKRWGFGWGIGTSFINFILLGYYYVSSDLFMPGLVSLISGVTFISLLVCRNSFQKRLQYGKPHQQLTSDPNQYSSESLLYLHDLINHAKSRPFGSDHLDEVRMYVSDLCPEKEKAKKLLNDYTVYFNKNLIHDLSGLSNNYEKIADLCDPFIRFELVKATYPHENI